MSHGKFRAQVWMSWPILRREASTHGRWRENMASANYAILDKRETATQCSRIWTRGFRTPGCRAWHKTLLKSTPRILNFYRCASNYSSAHLTRMNDIVAGIVLGGGGRVVIVENKKQKRQKIVEHASGSDFIPTLLSRPKQTCVRSCTQQLSHENTYFAIAPGFDGPAGCPTQSRIRFRRLWLR